MARNILYIAESRQTSERIIFSPDQDVVHKRSFCSRLKSFSAELIYCTIVVLVAVIVLKHLSTAVF